MGKVTKSIIINAPIDKVFSYLTGSIAGPEWLGGTPLEVKQRPSGPVRSGFVCIKEGTSIWREHRGTMGPTLLYRDHFEDFERTTRVTEFVENEKLVFQTETRSWIDSGGSPASQYTENFDYVTRPAANDATLATVSFDKRVRPRIRLLHLMLRPVNWVLSPLIRLGQMWRMARHMRRIKKEVESNNYSELGDTG